MLETVRQLEVMPQPPPELNYFRKEGEMFLGYKTSGLVQSYPFWAVCCTRCGHMTQYANQEFIAQAFEATTRQHMQEQHELAKRAAREQKRQQKKGLF